MLVLDIDKHADVSDSKHMYMPGFLEIFSLVSSFSYTEYFPLDSVFKSYCHILILIQPYVLHT